MTGYAPWQVSRDNLILAMTRPQPCPMDFAFKMLQSLLRIRQLQGGFAPPFQILPSGREETITFLEGLE